MKFLALFCYFLLCYLRHDIAHDFYQRWLRYLLRPKTCDENEILAHSLHEASEAGVDAMARWRHRGGGKFEGSCEDEQQPHMRQEDLMYGWRKSKQTAT